MHTKNVVPLRGTNIKTKHDKKLFQFYPFHRHIFCFRISCRWVKIWWCFKSIAFIVLKISFIPNCSQITCSCSCCVRFFSPHYYTCVLFCCCKGQVRHWAIRNLSPHLSLCHKNRKYFPFVRTVSSKSKNSQHKSRRSYFWCWVWVVAGEG